ncbi:hypothetical protein FAI41_01130 [Acetobacteraceae bacterium]|nr:hypothetical protein FAI41_01130 [Acetobacteraceae bacterium]
MKDHPQHLSPAFPFKIVFLTISCITVFLLGCSLHPFQRLGIGTSSPEARFYSYFILHGAAQSALGRGKLSPAQIKILVKADAQAKQNLINKAFEGKMERSLIHYELSIHP